jgi:hypothetical protein
MHFIGDGTLEDQAEFNSVAKGYFPEETFNQMVSVAAVFVLLFVSKDMHMR